MRTRRTIVETAATFALSFVGFGVGVPQLIKSPGDPTFLAVGGLLLGIVSLAVACSLLLAIATGAVHEVRITEQGVFYDGTEWPWDSVTRVRSTPILPSGVAYLSVSVKRGWLRPLLTLPIGIADRGAARIIDELKTYLDSKGYDIRWEQRAI